MYLGNVKIAELLIKTGANVNHKDSDGITALFRAVLYGNFQLIWTMKSIFKKKMNFR